MATRGAVLSAAGLDIIRHFKEVSTVDRQAGDEKHPQWPSSLFSAQSDRFELWAVNLGLFVSGHGSLEYRVREAGSLRATLLRFMLDLKDSLIEVLEYCNGTIDQFALDDDASAGLPLDLDSLIDVVESPFEDVPDSDIDLLLDSVKDPIDRLYKLSTRIRNPSTRFESSKALQYQKMDPESNVDFLQVAEHFDYDYVSSMFLQYRKSGALQSPQSVRPPAEDVSEESSYTDNVWEPVKSILSQYRADVSTNSEPFLVHHIVRANEVVDTPQAPQNLGDIAPPDAGPADLGERGELSITTATRLQVAQLGGRDDKSTISVSEYAPSSRAGTDIVDFPSPPKRPEHDKFFECPYCFTICPVEVLGKRAWKAHLIRDLRPYVCTYEHCKNPDQLYDTRRDWMQHENTTHRTVWRCPEHQEQPFATMVAYEAHLRDGHVASSSDMHDGLIHASESVLAANERLCPICAASADTAKELHHHIALHLERFALFSLPRSAGADDDDAEELGSEGVNLADDGSRETDEELEGIAAHEEDDDHDGWAYKSAASIARSRWNALLDRISRDQLGFDRSVLFGNFRSLRSPLRDMHDTASSYVTQGRLREAEELYVTILEARRRAFGSQHPRTLSSMSELAVVYERQGLGTKAEELLDEVARTRAKLLVLKPLTLGRQADRDLLTDYQRQLFEAVKTGNRAAVETLVSTAGVNPDALDSNDRTPLSWAAAFGDVPLVRLFLATPGVDPDAPDSRGQTPLSWAADCGHAEVVSLLLESGRVDPDSKDASGWTPLAWAASKGYDAVVSLLLTQDRVDTDSRSVGGLTPLGWALVNGYEQAARLILEFGKADVNYDGSEGQTLMSFAKKSGNDAVVELLEEYLPGGS
ncbi:hypothetical protein NKR23_g4736 [Pleurostoma richardsiae]|uniref:Oxidoreductase acuF-like C2H2 type zinc-finger domain-containing protein n=1 Tax=Pleurostoma richardsiae TaxID=41990 RepID=A0AA38RFR3_9PEZI|nr:hypothetical protein NKR23_g4736 [Pleurostoma richardsiae]